MPAPTIGALPTPPSRNNAPDVFASNADAFLGAFPTFRTEINALVGYLNSTAMILGQFQDGTVGLPSIRFEADTNTGFYRIAADTLGVSTGGAERARFNSTGMQLTGLLSGTAVTQSATDNTAGRLLKVGDFGLGATTLPGVTLNSAIVSGLYNYTAGDANNPSPGNGGAVLVQSLGETFIIQTARRGNGYQEWTRQSADNGATWSAWAHIHNNATILGTVSQASGVPTGAIIERGSNANGEYVRFADGTQICNASLTINSTISVALLGGYRNTGQTWIYPAAFAAVPRVIGSPGSLTSLSVIPNSANATAVSVFHTSVASQGTAADLVANMVAVGRWF